MKRLVAGIVVAGVCTAAGRLPADTTPASAGAAGQAAGAPSPADIVSTAKAHLGDRYATIGNSPATGFSCIGFVNYVFAQNGVNVPFDIPAAWNSAPRVAMNDLLAGDVLFFSNTVFAGLSHVAIYIGNGQMIGADSFAVGVTTDRLADSYWTQHYTGATRPLALVGTSPMPGSGTGGTSTGATATPPATPTNTPPDGSIGTSARATATATPAQQPAAYAPSGTLLQPLATTVGLYSGPGYGYETVEILGPSSVLVVLQGQGGWYDVRLGDTYGWVNAGDVGPVDGGYRVQAAATPVATQAAPQPLPTQEFSRAAAVASGADDAVLYVADGPLKIRLGPGKRYREIGYLALGTRLLMRDAQQGWAHVTTPTGLIGWVAMPYLSRTAPAPNTRAGGASRPATPQGAGFARVTAPVLNVRAQPDSHARVITVLFAGEAVQVLARGAGWDQITLRSGAVGWASAAWLADGARCGDHAGSCTDGGR